MKTWEVYEGAEMVGVKDLKGRIITSYRTTWRDRKQIKTSLKKLTNYHNGQIMTMNTVESRKARLEKKLTILMELAEGKIIFVEYYTHTKTEMYKVLNPWTYFGEEKLVLDAVTEGFEHSVDLAIEQLQEKKQIWDNQNNKNND